MKFVLWLLLGLVVGGIIGWSVRGLEQDVRASTNFAFIDKLADPPVLSSAQRAVGEAAT